MELAHKATISFRKKKLIKQVCTLSSSPAAHRKTSMHVKQFKIFDNYRLTCRLQWES